MTLLAMKHTVQLLHDARGIYGVGGGAARLAQLIR
jgi:hypothetical protein